MYSRISTTLFRYLLNGARKMGLPEHELLLAAGIDRDDLNSPDGFLDSESYSLLYQKLIELSDDPFLGLHIGENFEFNSMGVFGLVMVNARNGREIYERMVRFQSILGTDIRSEFVEKDDLFEVRVFMTVMRNEQVDRHCIESILVKNIQGVRLIVGDDTKPVKVSFRFPKPESLSEYQRIFNCELEFDAEHNSIHLPKSILSMDNPMADGRLSQYFDELANELLKDMEFTESMSLKVSRLLLELLDDSDISLETIADKMAIGVRTLQRKLNEEGTSFKQIVADTKRAVAVKYLKENHMAISEIAYVLGFSQPSAFHRSFKRWTGQTPQKYREEIFSVSA
ncbi:MAG: AraC family transcriptional regulator [Calditrichaeota bacterium]|nr:AraC family transcriptional regulator [Calditrichota bacterium]